MTRPTNREQKGSLSPAEKIGFTAFLLAVLLLFFDPWLATLPLFLFLILCLAAPFFPQVGFFLPIISRSVTGSKGVALTFDDGPSPSSTPIVLELLARYQLKATFFVVGEKAARHPDLIADILAQGHTIGNHSWQHDNLLMLRSRKRLQQDIHQTQEVLKQSGIQSLAFRPPAGISNSRLRQVLLDEDLVTVTFSCRIFDQGNKKITNLAQRVLQKLKARDILLLHDIAPKKEAMATYWKNELNTLFSSLRKGSYDVQPLERLIGQPVMIYQKNKGL
ncbi:MAG: polysaccharide deacetylase family protein [Proteobacteria bacterium]|jgi:peptidoglycan/xylan/chitin deacetylase (PgdA/CDA1 family)|nr:polysaccharide deacetylase family protein [Desulfocapsa sp.]MBU3945594.1 polysaccharide deacetylase family protein [Pseudomonadota bacterium]MCG2745156.1 polysaccharide deacetylase family protein [Desulfobacteraceae bacterium]MBU3982939.1 polysaccharide deacetylase family protein [Pseudomonadota bacterium]MBU4029801.1 polysaccharide deacetylase family protein [Pseudomonadota bacterium]